MLVEPVRARLTWKGGDTAEVRAFALNNDGSRARPITGDVRAGGAFRIDLEAGLTLHWELTRAGD
jgi:hypothetical protein